MKSIMVPATDDDPSPIVAFIEGELEHFDCSPKALYQIEVAIEEVLVNIVSYSGLSANDGIEFSCDVLEDPLRARMQFIDGGVPFNPLTTDDPDISPEGLMGREGGLGIFMVKKMMDDVSYAHENGKNVLTFVKNLQ